MTTYVGIIHKESGSDYGVSFPDFPGCISAGVSPDELQWNAQEALRFHIEGMVEDGEVIPHPMALDKAKKHTFAKGADAFIFVSAPTPSKPVRVNVMLDSALLAQIERVSSNRSEFLSEAAREKLGLV